MEIKKEKLTIKFKNIREIRMGSPYQVCEISFKGEWIPPLPDYDWQDIKAISPDKNQIALVRWNTLGNIPGFHIIRINVEKKSYHKTRKIIGICKKIYWKDGKFIWEKNKTD
mgnify:CR=1 FL=1